MHYCLHTNDKKYSLQSDDKSTLNEQDEWPHRLGVPGEVIYWSLLEDTKDIDERIFERTVINYALLGWSYKSKLTVKEAKHGETPTIRISFVDAAHDALFTENPNALAYAYFPGQGSHSGILKINDDEFWSTYGNYVDGHPSYDLQHTLGHEFGHTFGLTHETNYRDHMMWPYYNKQRTPQFNDQARMQVKYGIRELSLWKKLAIEYRLKRGVPSK